MFHSIYQFAYDKSLDIVNYRWWYVGQRTDMEQHLQHVSDI